MSSVGIGSSTAASASAGSLRSTKKARTQLALVEVSHRLFAERGYHETTLEAICSEVGVRVQTLLRHYESKAHLAMAPWYHRLATLNDLLDTRTGDAMSVWRRFVIEESVEAVQPSTTTSYSVVGSIKAFQAWADKDPVLVAMSSDIAVRYQRSLAAAIAADRGRRRDDVHSQLVAAMLVSGRAAVFERWVEHGGGSDSLVADQMALIDYVIGAVPRRGARAVLHLGERRHRHRHEM
jgi:AcrR family transcriptional regulator